MHDSATPLGRPHSILDSLLFPYSTLMRLFHIFFEHVSHSSYTDCKIEGGCGARTVVSNSCFMAFIDLIQLGQIARRDSPEIRSRPANVEADIGGNVTLRCDVNGNPEPEISWTFEGSRRVLSTGPAYTFWMNHDMAGKYTCTARVPGFAEVSADAHVFLKGPPTVRSKRIQFGLEGDTVRIECVAFAIPRPSKITWTHRGYEIDAGDPYVTFNNDPLPDGVRSTLIIREANDKYFGSYNCSVANDYGMDAAEIILRKETGNLQLLFISAGVVGGIVLLIACVMVIVVCQRRSNKKVEEGDKGDRTSKQSDQTSNNDSDLKVDIRTASSLSNPPESEQWDDSSERITPRAVITNGDAMYRYAPGDYTDAQCFP
ncbi:Irregular chiasm C-roughest protein, partial [Daphnia magna]